MKFIVKPTLVAVAVMAMMGCQEKETKPAVLETDLQKQAYALGSSMHLNIADLEEMGIQLDHDLIVAGFQESAAGNGQVDKEQIQQLLMALGQTVQMKQQELAAIKAEEAQAASAAFLSTNAQVEGVVTTESGLQYQVLTAAEGAKPAATDTVKVHYHGTLTDGTIFDSSVDRGEPIEFPLNRVIPGWTEGVQLMSVGSKYKFVIPSNLGYGANPAGQIPANSTLIFEVELLDITTPAPAADDAAAQ